MVLVVLGANHDVEDANVLEGLRKQPGRSAAVHEQSKGPVVKRKASPLSGSASKNAMWRPSHWPLKRPGGQSQAARRGCVIDAGGD